MVHKQTEVKAKKKKKRLKMNIIQARSLRVDTRPLTWQLVTEDGRMDAIEGTSQFELITI